MADILYYADLDLNNNQLKNMVVDVLAADPVAPADGQMWFNTTANLMRYFDGTSTIDISPTSLDGGDFEGTHDASLGAFPTPAADVLSGDKWIVSVAGTLPNGDVVEPGDFIFALVNNPNPATNADWAVLQGNLNLPSTVATCDEQVATLVAATPLTITSAIVPDIKSVEVYNSAGRQIQLCVEEGAGANQVVLTSNQALANIKVKLMGC